MENYAFKKFWDKKANKRRKSWEGKLQRRIANQTDMEELRADVFKPFSKTPSFSYVPYITEHRTLKNPFVEWKKGVISFSEQSLRDALTQHGADLGEFKYASRHDSVKEGFHTDVETFTLTLRNAVMTIKRFSTEGVPFGYYEITPTEQYAKDYPMRMEETGFYTLNIATLLMDMAAECDLREEEFMYYVKGMKLGSVQGTVSEDIEFKLWNEAQIPAKVKMVINRNQYYDEHNAVKAALRPWMKAVEEFMNNISLADKDQEDMLFKAFARDGWSRRIIDEKGYIDKVFLPYLASQGLQEATAEVQGNGILIAHKGYKMFIGAPTAYQEEWQCHVYPYLEETDSNWEEIIGSPSGNGYREVCRIGFHFLTLSAIAKYLKLMAKYKDQIYGMKAKVIATFKELKG